MKISVIIPFYNLEAYVATCLGSVRTAFEGSPDAELEVLAIDDGSTDGTARCLDDWAEKAANIPRFAFKVVHKVNGGEGSARNAGLKLASGEWVTFLDGDDLWLPNYLEALCGLAKRYPQADVIGGRFAPFVDGAEPPSLSTETPIVTCHELGAEIPGEVVLQTGVFPTLFRRTTIAGLEFSALPLGADRLYVAHGLARATCAVLSTESVHGYRVREGSMARAAWTVRKVCSQCDYASGALKALIGSGRTIGKSGLDYLSSLWLSDVPSRILRLESATEREECAAYWLASMREMPRKTLSMRYRFAVRIFLSMGGMAAVRCARWLRRVGVV